ncbi:MULTISPECIES: AAA family ATPase [unclassified Leifsonia]|uniref:AAA family ATPase n=1 Tax=unclassified Leifsonia TaxID=2663824 RepID=UPI00087DC8D3|nr:MULTISPECIES: AAA family ATPase [unclassified Leifsonia]SDH47161.1 Adenylate kinase [Leifsonia sp. 197AMF]SDI90327.1 Adenylate kinase [Leifsonia sp. 466MF]SDJ89993.1 Adenylate kinase [Leifsonia sp. 157MF]
MLSYGDALPGRPRRVVVAGVSGSGKTTLAGRIAQLTGGPHTEIDGLRHGPGWEPRPEFVDDVDAFTAAEAWTTEWQYSAVRDLLAERADLLVWLDLPFARVTLPRVVRRTLHRRIHRTELWNGNHEPRLRTIFRDPEHIIRWSISSRNTYAERVPVAERAHPHLVVVRLRSTREVEHWLAGPLQAATATNSS